jgi:hypothetical protein
MKHRYAMTRRDVGMLRIFTSQTTLRENTQPYRFRGLKIFTPLTLRFQDFQRLLGVNWGKIASAWVVPSFNAVVYFTISSYCCQISYQFNS